ncbi:hypothetical protein C923_00005 [Plasmodium falciparum UGT5.1]|uniref:Uncharacterized protein n=1 Tax=Plasmodium falciparum UGT5.1 TaxID=1237627 RepID=W7K5I8_PLAFA|nr:hypothetical protein C923_00005 [Plasmodium falciparum UGT5.1]
MMSYIHTWFISCHTWFGGVLVRTWGKKCGLPTYVWSHHNLCGIPTYVWYHHVCVLSPPLVWYDHHLCGMTTTCVVSLYMWYNHVCVVSLYMCVITTTCVVLPRTSVYPTLGLEALFFEGAP